MSTAWSLTVGVISRPGVEPSLSETVGFNDEMGAEIGGETVDVSVVANTGVDKRLTPTTGAFLDGILKVWSC